MSKTTDGDVPRSTRVAWGPDRSTSLEGCGFRRDAIYPCYGLAEGTLLVTGAKETRDPVVRTFDAGALETRRVVSSEAPGARKLVGCGSTLLDQEIRIVDPATPLPKSQSKKERRGR